MLEELSIVERPRGAREKERRHANGAPDQHRENHAGKPTPRGARDEEFGKLSPGRVATTDDDRFERKPRQYEALEPRRSQRVVITHVGAPQSASGHSIIPSR